MNRTSSNPLQELAACRALLAQVDGGGCEAAVQVDVIDELRALQAAASAALARVSVRFGKDRVRSVREAGGSLDAQRASVVGELALAHRVSPARMARELPVLQRLVDELPLVHGLLAAGAVSEWLAVSVARAARGLTSEQLARLDALIAPELPSLSVRQAEGRVRAFCLRVEPEAELHRHQLAAREANVSCRPVADGMARVSILAPTAQAVGMYAAVRRRGEQHRTADESLGHAMAEAAFELLTGLHDVESLPIEIQLVMTDRALLDPTNTDPARLMGGPGVTDAWIDAEQARRLALGHTALGRPAPGRTMSGRAIPGRAIPSRTMPGHLAPGLTAAPRWLRRWYTDPVTGSLRDLDTRRRHFTEAQRRFIAFRDQICTTPWCDAPIRDCDHAIPHHEGGTTDLTNGNGKCQRCNLRKDLPGWATSTRAGKPGVAHRVTVTTPSGHRYSSTSPPALAHWPEDTT